VAISGDTVVAGAPTAHAGQGAVYTFGSAGGPDRAQTAELTAAGGTAGDHLGASVAIAGGAIAAGAPGTRVGAHPQQGAAYLFAAAGAPVRNETATLTATDGAVTDRLGSAVAIAGDSVVAGAPNVFAGPRNDRGRVYTFSASAGTQTAELRPAAGAAGDLLGTSVAIAGDAIVAGAPLDADRRGDRVGAVYRFAAGGAAVRRPTAKLSAASATKFSALGTSVAMDGDGVVAGAPGRGLVAALSGAGSPPSAPVHARHHRHPRNHH
jgi:hypothetical protein